MNTALNMTEVVTKNLQGSATIQNAQDGLIIYLLVSNFL